MDRPRARHDERLTEREVRMASNGSAVKGRALVTGASGGIGLELARELARHGHPVVLAARSAEKLDALAAELSTQHGVRAVPLPADLADASGAERLVAALRERGLDVDVLVNNAGVGMHGPFFAGDAAGQLALLQLNVVSLTLLTRLLLPAMVARRVGRVLNVASTAAFVPGPFMATYYASKAYVLSLSVALANELSGSGVTVTALCPGPTRTGFGAAAGITKTRLFRRGAVMDAATVARVGYEGMMSGKPIVVPGVRNRLLAGTSGLAPRTLTARIARALQDPADLG
jgi:short-subunit dehydrogenase